MELKLLDCVNDLLKEVETKTGKSVLIKMVSSQKSMVEAKTARENDDNHIITYSEHYSPEINHIIASKAIQFIRTYEEKDKNRKIAVAYNEHIQKARLDIAAEIETKPYLEIAVNDESLISTWVLSLINQLISQPVNINIERIIYEKYPDLRVYQENIINNQLNDFNLTLIKDVKDISPGVIYNNSAIMNYVYLKMMEDITGGDFISRLNFIVKKGTSEKLYKYTRDNLQQSFKSDIDIIDYWADYLRIDSWFIWEEFDKKGNR